MKLTLKIRIFCCSRNNTSLSFSCLYYSELSHTTTVVARATRSHWIDVKRSWCSRTTEVRQVLDFVLGHTYPMEQNVFLESLNVMEFIEHLLLYFIHQHVLNFSFRKKNLHGVQYGIIYVLKFRQYAAI